MSDLPRISIVTPTLNQGKYIQKTIDSVLNQDYPHMEYLVIDGGSTDDTRAILDCYENRLIWRIEVNHRQSQAINKGWQLAEGEVIAWINSDDYYMPDALKLAGMYMHQHPEVDMVYGNCEYVGANGEFLRPYPTKPYNYVELVRQTFNYIPQPATFIRRHVLESVGYLDENLDLVMDFDFWLRIGLSHRIVHIPEMMAALRLQPEAKSLTHLDRFGEELVKMYHNYFERQDLPASIIDLKRQALANIYHRAADCAFWGKDYLQARRFVVQSWRYQQWPLRRSWFWIALGRLGGRITGSLYKNPYTP